MFARSLDNLRLMLGWFCTVLGCFVSFREDFATMLGAVCYAFGRQFTSFGDGYILFLVDFIEKYTNMYTNVLNMYKNILKIIKM